MLKKLWKDEGGALLSAELVLVMTLVFCGIAVGVGAVRTALVQELADVAEAIGTLNQSYSVSGLADFHHLDAQGNPTGCSAQAFHDAQDLCDSTVDCFQTGPSKCIQVCIPTPHAECS